jgi:hypothetical protein
VGIKIVARSVAQPQLEAQLIFKGAISKQRRGSYLTHSKGGLNLQERASGKFKDFSMRIALFWFCHP